MLKIFHISSPSGGLDSHFAQGYWGGYVETFPYTQELGRRLYALAEQIATYEPLWAWLGGTYTLQGGLMVGGLMFGWWALRAWWR
jgi:hypothetical protein